MRKRWRRWRFKRTIDRVKSLITSLNSPWTPWWPTYALYRKLILAWRRAEYRLIGNERWIARRQKYLDTHYTHHDWESNWHQETTISESDIQRAVEERDRRMASLTPIGLVQVDDDYIMLYEDADDN
uniref:Uncharacterized protein n=1 Tax=viral metagenome TaxID=1070528 RepID=A0A6M3LYS4_9ZZZZ